MKNILPLSLSLALAAALSACGAGSDEEEQVAATTSGVFRDAPVSGLWYQSRTGNAYTGSGGVFSYKPGETYTFFVGKVKLGSFTPTTDNATVTPANLVATSGTAAARETTILNLVRFLMTLDADGAAANGISIASTTDEDALNWAQFDFSLSTALDLGSSTSAKVAMQGVKDSNGKVLAKGLTVLKGITAYTAELDARNHLKSSMACAYAGAYTSEQQSAGALSSRLAVVVDGAGVISVLQYLPSKSSFYHFSSPTAFDYRNVLADDSSSTAVDSLEEPTQVKLNYRHSLLTTDQVYVRATATNDLGNASLQTASRLSGLPTALYRLAGTVAFPANNYAYQLEVSPANTVSGRILNMLTGKSAALTGSYTQASGVYTLTASATVDSVPVSLSGAFATSTYAWTPTASENNVALASALNVKGCKLN